MGYKIGIDFGTTNSTVSYVDTSRKDLKAFKFVDHEYIPSCIAYGKKGSVSVGDAALSVATNTGVTFYNNFKMFLPLLSPKDREKYSWNESKVPEDVITDYLKHILTESRDSFKIQKGDIEGIVLSVPHVWNKGDMAHPGREKLQDIIKTRLGLPFIQLVSEPVAAAAYYAYKMKFTGNLLICDMGGGTFDVTLCKVTPNEVVELHNEGNGEIGLGKAGVFFDRELILTSGKFEDITQNSEAYYELYGKLQAYKRGQHDTIEEAIINAIDLPRLRSENILEFGKKTFNFHEIEKAFAEVKAGIDEVLKKFNSAIEKKYDVNAIFFVGGFAQFYLVKKAIKETLKIGEKDPRFSENTNNEMARYAISYGAALLANGMVSIEEKYEHTIGIEGLKRLYRKDVVLVPKLIPIIKGGEVLSAYKEFCWSGKDEILSREDDAKLEIPLYIQPVSGKVQKIMLTECYDIKLPNEEIPNNHWYIGLRIDKSKIVYLVFKDKDGQKGEEYELGGILRLLQGGLRIGEAKYS